MTKDGRPQPCANIYNHGFLKNKNQLAIEKDRISRLKFKDLINECKPFSRETAQYLQDLVAGTDITDQSLPLHGDTDK